jgi:hypothetical protein
MIFEPAWKLCNRQGNVRRTSPNRAMQRTASRLRFIFCVCASHASAPWIVAPGPRSLILCLVRLQIGVIR